MKKRKISFSLSGLSLYAYDYSIIMHNKINHTAFANGSIKTSVVGKSIRTIKISGLIPCGKVTSFISAFSSFIGMESHTLSLDGHTMTATLDRYEIRPADEPGLLDFTLTLH